MRFIQNDDSASTEMIQCEIVCAQKDLKVMIYSINCPSQNDKQSCTYLGQVNQSHGYFCNNIHQQSIRFISLIGCLLTGIFVQKIRDCRNNQQSVIEHFNIWQIDCELKNIFALVIMQFSPFTFRKCVAVVNETRFSVRKKKKEEEK